MTQQPAGNSPTPAASCPDPAGLEATWRNASRKLVDARTAAGHWEGRLSSSALSTATAVFAIELHLRQSQTSTVGDARLRVLADAGVRWLTSHQNADGGWGDTLLSSSNVSTTALCWAALAWADDGTARDAERRAAAWLSGAAGSTEPAALARTIIARYGKDRTFSVPILTMCALAGRLGQGRSAWRWIPQLPFELAAFPQQWFQWLKLPVVSYALPALISMGIVRHTYRPTWNPVTRLLRRAAGARAMRMLDRVQPPGGGFLEATPLTSFVAMSLIGAHQGDHPVVARCLEFLTMSAREDGSWPIDTNLATWVTTLSVNALALLRTSAPVLSDFDRRSIHTWLLSQQYRVVHPYTLAAPGAWAWTDLPGGVPDADDTAGALLALWHLGQHDEPTIHAATAGITWLLDLQNRDGGIPTFCRGWGNLPFDRSGADLTAHALQAWSAWEGVLPERLQNRIRAAETRALKYLALQQREDGCWIPLWFGNESTDDESNPTYGTSRVLMALQDGGDEALDAHRAWMRVRGAEWLAAAQNSDGSWGGAEGVTGSIEETSLAITALAACRHQRTMSIGPWIDKALIDGGLWLMRATQQGTRFPPAPIGFYFARLWYFEDHYPLAMCIGALAQLLQVFGIEPARWYVLDEHGGATEHR